MKRRLLRFLGWAVYAGFLLAIFTAAGYLSFSRFVRGGGTEVPDLVGLPIGSVEELVVEAGLDYSSRQDSRRYDDLVPTDHVLRQSPPAGTLVKRGATVDVVLSLGPS